MLAQPHCMRLPVSTQPSPDLPDLCPHPRTHSPTPAAEGDYLGAAVRYALLAEQGSPSAELNLAWLLHRGLAYRGADRHRLALGLWERAAFRGQTEGRLMAAHVLLDGHKYGLEGGARFCKPGCHISPLAERLATLLGPAHHLPPCIHRPTVIVHCALPPGHLTSPPCFCPCPTGANASRAAGLFSQAAAAGSVEGMFMLGRLRELGLGLPQDPPEAMRLYRAAIARAPLEAYAMAPFLALHWLRLRLLLHPLLHPLLRVLAAVVQLSVAEQPPAAQAGVVVAAGGTAQQPGHRSPSLPAQWDTLLLLALVGVLTWVLWRKRQLGQQPAPAAAAATAAPAPQAEPAAVDARSPAEAIPEAASLELPTSRQATGTPPTPPQETPERPIRSAAVAAATERWQASAARSDAVVSGALRLRTAAAKAERQDSEPGGGDPPSGARL